MQPSNTHGLEHVLGYNRSSLGQRCNNTLASRNRAWLAWRGNPFPKSGRGAVHVPRSSEIRTVRMNLCKVTLPGDGHRKHHDEVKYALHRVLTQAGLKSTLEVPESGPLYTAHPCWGESRRYL